MENLTKATASLRNLLESDAPPGVMSSPTVGDENVEAVTCPEAAALRVEAGQWGIMCLNNFQGKLLKRGLAVTAAIANFLNELEANLERKHSAIDVDILRTENEAKLRESEARAREIKSKLDRDSKTDRARIADRLMKILPKAKNSDVFTGLVLIIKELDPSFDPAKG